MFQQKYDQSNLYHSEVSKQNFTSQVKFTQREKKPAVEGTVIST